MSKAGKQRVPDYLEHIREAISRIQKYVQSMEQATFETDERTQDAPGKPCKLICLNWHYKSKTY